MCERCSNVRFIPAIQNAKLFKVGQYRERRLVVPAVANCLKVEGGIVSSGMWFLCFNVKAHIPEVGRQKSIVHTFSKLARGDTALDLYFLFIRIGLLLVIDVPTERNPKLVDEIETGLRFGISRQEVTLFVLLENGNKFFDAGEGFIEGLWDSHCATL